MARVARIPKLLWALHADGLRIVTVYFSQYEFERWESLDGLAALNQELDELVESSHLPRLEKIRFDVNSPWDGRNLWNECFAEMFPRLWKQNIMEHLVIAVDPYESSTSSVILSADLQPYAVMMKASSSTYLAT